MKNTDMPPTRPRHDDSGNAFLWVVLLAFGAFMAVSLLSEMSGQAKPSGASTSAQTAGAALPASSAPAAAATDSGGWLADCNACTSLWRSITGTPANATHPSPAKAKLPEPTLTPEAPLSVATRKLAVNPRAGWVDTGLLVSPGARVSIIPYAGSWSADGDAHTSVDGGGYHFDEVTAVQKWHEAKYLPAAPFGALLASFDKGASFEVGRGHVAPARAGGRLFLRINEKDDGLADNRGVINVNVEIQTR